MTRRSRAVMGAVMLGLVVFALGVFLLPFAFPTPPGVVTRFQGTSLFSPNGDGRRDEARVSVRVRDPGTLTLEIRNDDRVVYSFADAAPVTRGWKRFRWDGRDQDGNVAPDGTYAVRIDARAGEKKYRKSRKITIDTTPPAVPETSLVSAGIGEVPRGAQCALTVTSPDDARLRVQVRRANGTPPEPVRALGPRPEAADKAVRWNWNGLDSGGRTVAPGLYSFRIESRDAARNGVLERRTCWVGNLTGAVTSQPVRGTRIGVRLRRPDGTALDGTTPTALRLYRRAGTPGLDTEVLGAQLGTATGRASGVSIVLPLGSSPAALWLVAEAAGGRALIALGAP